MDDFLYQVWDYKHNIKRTGLNITLQGDAISARYSGFWINEWKIMLDAGLQSPYNPEHIFITHTHSDHIEKLAQIITGVTIVPNIYIPKGTIEFVQNYLNSVSRMTTMNKYVVASCNLIECESGDIFELKFNGKDFQVKVFETKHRITSVGFAFSEYKKVLKPEYIGLPSAEFGKMAREGIEFSEYKPVEQLIYTGDTENDIFDNDEIDWGKYSVIITESTFIQELSDKLDHKINVVEHGADKGHNYLEAILNTANQYSDTQFILCHWSTRYKKEDLIEYFNEKRNQENFYNIVPYINTMLKNDT